MRQLKRKDLILEHYKCAIKATVIDNVKGNEITVRVWKPKMMGKLPAYHMLKLMRNAANELYLYRRPQGIIGPKERGAVYVTGNPDWGAWDMQTVTRMDYKRQTVDIYIAALLMRPFSQEAQKHYEERMGLDVWDRLLLMWDSRQFDEDGGYDTSFGKITQFNEDWPDYHSLYRVVNEFNDIEEGTM